MNRREFVRGCVCVLAGIPLCGLSCTHIFDDGATPVDVKNYYSGRSDDIKKKIGEYLPVMEEVLSGYMQKNEAAAFIKKAVSDFMDFLPRLPYIGGEENPYTFSLISGAFQMKYTESLLNKGLSRLQCGKIGYDTIDIYFGRLSWMTRWFMSHFVMSAHKFRKMAMRKVYSGYDWKIDFVEGNDDFDFGINVLQCGLVRLYAENGMSDFLPFVCAQDFANIKHLDIRLERSEVLSRGASRCDFRYRKCAEAIEGWPPEKLRESKNSKGNI